MAVIKLSALLREIICVSSEVDQNRLYLDWRKRKEDEINPEKISIYAIQ